MVKKFEKVAKQGAHVNILTTSQIPQYIINNTISEKKIK